MQYYPKYEQTDFNEVVDLIKTVPMCTVLSRDDNGKIYSAVFNPLYHEENIVIHLNKKDEQLAHFRSNGFAQLVFHDMLAVIPSHWAGPDYAGSATSYYRFAEIECEAQLIEAPEDQVHFYKSLMKHYQPEGQYAEISHDSPVYKGALNALCIVVFKIKSVRTKWKLGQNRSVEDRRMYIEKLKERNRPNDLRCCQEMEKIMALEEKA